jgi:hypothetical protein
MYASSDPIPTEDNYADEKLSVAGMPEWQILWVVPATAVLVLGSVVPVGYLRAKCWNGE